MIKNEIKVEISNNKQLLSIIEKAYFKGNNNGKISGKHSMEIEESDDINYSIFKDLDGATVKITNSEIIEGSMRFMINEDSGKIQLNPISLYCIKEEGKYIFY